MLTLATKQSRRRWMMVMLDTGMKIPNERGRDRRLSLGCSHLSNWVLKTRSYFHHQRPSNAILVTASTASQFSGVPPPTPSHHHQRHHSAIQSNFVYKLFHSPPPLVSMDERRQSVRSGPRYNRGGWRLTLSGSCVRAAELKLALVYFNYEFTIRNESRCSDHFSRSGNGKVGHGWKIYLTHRVDNESLLLYHTKTTSATIRRSRIPA